MMRIATPETVWPRHFFNRLNKMQTRASKINEAKNDASKPNAEGANDSDEKTSDNAGGNISQNLELQKHVHKKVVHPCKIGTL